MLSAIAGYAYLITHTTCGIDDVSIDVYFTKGLGVAIGRWPFYLIGKILPVGTFYPAVSEIVGVLLMMMAAVCWCGLFRMIFGDRISMIGYIVFSVIFMDYSLVAEVFTFYLQNGLGFVYLFTVLALIGFYRLYSEKLSKKQRIWMKLWSVAGMTLAVSFYESAASIYLSGALLIVLFVMYADKESEWYAWKRLFWMGFYTVRVLVYSMVIRRVARAVLMRLFGIAPYSFYRNGDTIFSISDLFGSIMADIWNDYFVTGLVYYPIAVFVLASVLFIGILSAYCFRNKNYRMLLVGVLFYISLFVLSFLQGSAVVYRACQMFSIFVGVVLMYLVQWGSKRPRAVKAFVGTAVVLCILGNVYDINRWFVVDYKKVSYDESVIRSIGEELSSGKYDIANKPICVVGDFELPEALQDCYSISEEDIRYPIFNWSEGLCDINLKGERYYYCQNYNSTVDWAVEAFYPYFAFNEQMDKLFQRQGYEFTWTDQELTESILKEYYEWDYELYHYANKVVFEELYDSDESYPNPTYIEEKDNYIVIKL